MGKVNKPHLPIISNVKIIGTKKQAQCHLSASHAFCSLFPRPNKKNVRPDIFEESHTQHRKNKKPTCACLYGKTEADYQRRGYSFLGKETDTILRGKHRYVGLTAEGRRRWGIASRTVRGAKRLERIEKVKKPRAEGMRIGKIAEHFGVHSETISRDVRAIRAAENSKGNNDNEPT